VLSDSCETVVLALRDVLFRHAESKSLSEFILEKYGFRICEDKTKEISKPQKPQNEETTEGGVEETKYSTTKTLSGHFSDSEIKIAN